MMNLIKSIIIEIKYFLQKLFRGYSEDEIIGFNCALMEWALPRLKYYRHLLDTGYCGLPYNESTGTTFQEEEWKSVIDDIIYAFEWELDILPEKEYEDNANMMRSNRGLEYFSKYWLTIWI